uniref:Uncharacterized protein n=1 Tax=Erpetoichthys calabaricus TaxID=27687 RepID=A0A8C4SWC4_ERPCA
MEKSGKMEEGRSANQQPKTFLIWSILNLLCCCFPLGLAAVICSMRVENANSVGDASRAKEASRIARALNITGCVLGALIVIIGVALYIFVLSKQH